MLSALIAASWLALASSDTTVIRVNQVGYLPDAPKVAVLCTVGRLDSDRTRQFIVRDQHGRRVLGPKLASMSAAFGPCAQTWRLDFSTVHTSGRYTIEAGGVTSPSIRIGRDV
jgi:endoglucanase